VIASLLAAPFLLSGVLGMLAGRIGRGLPPAAAVIGLTVTALASALSTGFALTALGATVLAQIPPLAEWAGVSVAALDATEPLPDPVAIAAGVVAVVLLALAARQVLITLRQLRDASRLCAELAPAATGLVIVDEPRAEAYSISGFRRSRIVVSREMMRALPAAERRVLLAHEAAHVRCRHHLFVAVSEVAAAANPLVRSVSREVRVGVERWADEAAAAEAGDRRVAATALARAGLARMRSGGADPAGALAGAGADLPRRVDALLAGRPRRRPAVVLALVVMVVVLLGTSTATAHNVRERLGYADYVFDHR